MQRFRRARVPRAYLPAGLGEGQPQPYPGEDTALVDIDVEGDRIAAVHAHDHVPAPVETETIDADGRLLFPGLVDVHTHLDKAHTWFRAPNPSGTFDEAIRILAEDTANWSEDDLLARGRYSLQCAVAHGTTALRTHLDSSPDFGDVAHAVTAQLREAFADTLTLQSVSLCGMDAWDSPRGEAIAQMTRRHGGSALGGFSKANPDIAHQLDRLLATARDYELGVDLHVDETHDCASVALHETAKAVLRNGFEGRVVCGHCCSLSQHDPKQQQETLALCRDAGLGIVSLSMCNLYLQGRAFAQETELTGPLTPQWRGLTLVHELLAAGVPVAFASDNVRDAFFAFGDFDMAEVLNESWRIAHLDTRPGEGLRSVAQHPAWMMGLGEVGRIDAGARAALILFEARNLSELLSRRSLPRRVFRGERELNATPPPYAELPELRIEPFPTS
ncbi:MAG: cytosine deaminase [Opitutales bacterium]